MELSSRVQLLVGQTFGSWAELKKVIVDEGVQTERVLVTHKKDAYKWKIRCKMNDATLGERSCPWRMRATLLSRTEMITITVANLLHSCEASDHYQRRMHANSDRLADRILEIILKNRQTRASFLRDSVQALIHPDIKYHTAYAAKKRCLKRLDGDVEDSFQLIPAHCQHILNRDPLAIAKWSAPDNHFETLFVCPSASRDAYKHCRPMVAFDGTHTRSTYPGILLLATTMDANNTVIVLAYSWVPIENKELWLTFMQLLRDAIPELSKAGTVFISDREKGLQEGVPLIFPDGHAAYCTWHLAENVQKHHGKEMRKLFEALPYATTAARFERRLNHIKDKKKEAAEYIRGTTDPSFYCRAFFPSRRWGHETSQQAESMNRTFKPQRQEATLNMSSQLWDYMMVKYFEKRELANSITTPFPPNIMAYLQQVEEKAFHLIADPSTRTEIRVTDELGNGFIVTLDPDWKCTCGDFQDMLLPCKHAWRALTALKLRHFDYVSPYYNTDTFRRTYEGHLPVLLREDLEPNKHCGPPLKRRKAGRPSERIRERFQDEELCRLPRKCGVCGQRGHDRRNCEVRELGRAAMRQAQVDEVAADTNVDSSPDSRGSDSELESSQLSPLLQTQESIQLEPWSQVMCVVCTDLPPSPFL